jgi:hypothetical protein
MLLKKSQPQKKEVSERKPEVSIADLKAQLLAAHDAAEAYIAQIAARDKAASPLQPLAWHELQLRLRYGRAGTECALKLIEAEEKNNAR